MKKYMAIIAAFIIAFQVFCLTATVFAADSYILETADYGDIRDTMSDTWVAIDDLGREVSTGDTVRDVQEEKHVLMFYYTWHLPMHVQDIYDISKILAGKQSWGGSPAFHYWGEPYFGYYRSDDPWVIRKDIQMLCDAGVDGVFFDAGNGYLYHDAYKVFFEENMKRKEEGQAYLKATWMIKAGGPLNSVSNVLKELHMTYYTTDEYKDVLYMINGKPLMLCPESAPNSTELKSCFEVRDCWAWSSGAGKWPWLEDSPQIGGWAKGNTSQEREMVSVAAAQHPTSNMGKSFKNGIQPSAANQQPEKGIYFTEQWGRALQLDPQFVLVTQWNEWMAQRFISNGSDAFLGRTLPAGETYFVDAYSAEYSRDIAPMKGGYGDNHYYLLTDFIRKFKGARDIPVYNKQQTVDMKNFSTINNSESAFYDDLYDTLHRDHPGAVKSGYYYTDTSGRNDFEEVRVATDSKNIYFYVKTVENITSPSGTNWMNLLLNTDADYDTGWHGYDFVVNRKPNGTKTSIEKYGSNGAYTFTSAGEATITYSGKEMIISVPRDTVKITDKNFTVDFKFADNVPEQDDIMLFIDKGDVAPNNRFNYRYIFADTGAQVTPDPAPVPTPTPGITDKIYADIGTGFDAQITKVDSGLNLDVSGRNVVLKTADAKSKKQTFRFERMADGSYKITSTYNGFVLAVDGGCTEDTNVLIDSNDNSFSQRWFVRLIDGKYLFIPARNEKCVLGVTGSATGSNVLVKTFTDKASQFFTLSNVTEIDGYNDTASKDGSLTASQQEVMRNIIYGLETGGMRYGQKDYKNFVGGSSEPTITIGAGCWSGTEAKELLNLIRETYPQRFNRLDTAGVAKDLDTADWSAYQLNKRSSKARCIISIISSTEGIACQDALMDKQINQYVKDAYNLGVTDVKALMMCVNIRHLDGVDSQTRMLAKAMGNYTLEALYSSLLTDTGNQAGAFRERNWKVYNWIMDYVD